MERTVASILAVLLLAVCMGLTAYLIGCVVAAITGLRLGPGGRLALGVGSLLVLAVLGVAATVGHGVLTGGLPEGLDEGDSDSAWAVTPWGALLTWAGAVFAGVLAVLLTRRIVRRPGVRRLR